MTRLAIGFFALVVAALVVSTVFARLQRAPGPRRGADDRVIRVEVLNGSGEGGVGARVAAALRAGGFHVVEVKNADRMDYFATMVVARRDDLASAREVARYLGGLPVIRQTRPSDLAEVTLVLGADRSRLQLD